MTSSSVWSSAMRRRVYLVAALLLGALGSFAHPPHAFEPAILLPLIGRVFFYWLVPNVSVTLGVMDGL